MLRVSSENITEMHNTDDALKFLIKTTSLDDSLRHHLNTLHALSTTPNMSNERELLQPFATILFYFYKIIVF